MSPTSSMRRALARGTALVLSLLVGLAAVEVWVRWSWDDRRGSPAFFLADPVLAMRLAPGYTGWFGGVPVRINNLGFRDARDYELSKPGDTFRILVLGDSVAFGHGSVYEHTYPYLLEQQLRAWRPAVNWEVWNTGVPGYNTSQQLAYLQRIGPVSTPDLVVVAFFPNDVSANDIVTDPRWQRRASAAISNFLRQWFYSIEFYRRVYLQLQWRWFQSESSQRLLANLNDHDAMLTDPGQVVDLDAQALTAVDVVTDDQVAKVECAGRADAPDEIRQLKADPSFADWQRAIQGFRALHESGTYRIVFFVNTAPEPCPDVDLFFDGGSRLWDTFFAAQLDGLPTVSTYDAFLHHRPSQMPGAKVHSLGNANRLKARVLFDFIKSLV